jgi:hypothetical protein
MWEFDDLLPPGPYRNQNLSTLKQMQVAQLHRKLTSSLLAMEPKSLFPDWSSPFLLYSLCATDSKKICGNAEILMSVATAQKVGNNGSQAGKQE